MKLLYSIPILVVSILCYSEASAQLDYWRPQNPPTIAGDINALQMISPTMAYAVGASSSFIIVSDSGRDWNVKFNINGKTNLQALSFIDPKIGMIVGSGAALKTSDGGITWKKMDIKIGGTTSYNSVLMLSKDIAMIVGNVSSILRTTDGGATWKAYGDEFGIGQLKSIKKIREDLLVVSGELGNFLFSSDSGKSWTKVKSQFGNTVNDFVFSDAKSAIAVGERGLVLTTSDTGKTWAMRPWDTTTFPIINDLLGVDQKSGNTIAVGGWGTVVHSTDQGAHWKKAELPVWVSTAMAFHDISMWDKNYGMAVGDFGSFIRTTDGGDTWVFIPQNPLFTSLKGIAFPKGDSSHGIAVGEGGVILRTSDGGKKWNPVTTSVIDWKTNLYGVDYADSITAWACGEYGTVLKTTDYGNTWIKIPVQTTVALRSVSFIDKDMGWISGDGTRILETKTGGLSWHYLVNDSTGFDAGPVSLYDHENGMYGFAYTTDGGHSWKGKGNSGKTFIANTDGYSHIITAARRVIVGQVYDDGKKKLWGYITTQIGDSIYRYGDEFTTLNINFHGVDFGDSLHGTVVGSLGASYQTTDGGITWVGQDSRTSFILFAVSMPLSNVASSAGMRGSINRRTNKLPVTSVLRQSPGSNSDLDIISIYPNPAREASTLRFQLQRPMPIELRIYDLKGILVQSSDLGLMTAGQYEQSLSFAGLATGGYIVELRSPEYSKHIILQAGE